MTDHASSTSARPPGWADYALLLLIGLILGSNFMMTKITVQALPPMLVVVCRIALASVFLCTLMVLARKWFPPRGPIWWSIVGSAFFGHTLPFALIAWGQQKVDAGLAAILMATMPLFTLLLAQLFTRDEKPNRYSVCGFVIALAGIVILFGPEKLASLADQSLRQYALVGAAMCYGVNAIITKNLTSMDWQQSTATFMCVALAFALPLLLLVDFDVAHAAPHVWFTVLYTGIVPTAIGAVLIVFLIRRAGASFLSQINFLVPLVGVGTAMAFLGERLPANGALALFIILVGVAIARRRPKRELISINKGV